VNFLIISDFFLSDLPYGGGAEYNDQILYQLFSEKQYKITRVRSREITVETLKQLSKKTKIIVSNFIQLSENSKNYITNNFEYIIYEHDHKYLRRRVPSLFYNFKAPDSEIINYNFYKSAKAVLVQSGFHKKIIELNIDINNVINLSGNLWTDDDFEQFKKNLSIKKEERCSILNSRLENKGTQHAVSHCEKNKISYELIADVNYYKFLEKIAKNKKLIFLPTIPETLSRICIEARMMGCTVITNGMVGAKYEDWYALKGNELINLMRDKRDGIINTIHQVFKVTK
jgi:hypothetical protein|tara:strand:+ start:146 stop:1003 length:858 start_codon:yes stop_codon:yes gene_type:complete